MDCMSHSEIIFSTAEVKCCKLVQETNQFTASGVCSDIKQQYYNSCFFCPLQMIYIHVFLINQELVPS